MKKYERNKLKLLKGEDRERMERLFKEITARVQEMSAMMSGLHGTSLRWTRFEISSSGTSGTDGTEIRIEICNHETGECGIYDYVAGTCEPSDQTCEPLPE